jgi:hypothetical protein
LDTEAEAEASKSEARPRRGVVGPRDWGAEAETEVMESEAEARPRPFRGETETEAFKSVADDDIETSFRAR